MKLILKEYLASLKERKELDTIVLPNLLSALGLQVLNLPMIGTRQNGVDIAAVGKIKGVDDVNYLYLLCIKAGNIGRNDWDGNPQAVRSELNEIRDVYLRSSVSAEHSELPVKIVVVCGGLIDEAVRQNYASFSQQNQTETIFYLEWNGDKLADFMLTTMLARELLDDAEKRNFQKALAMVNEPDSCYDYTRNLLRGLLRDDLPQKDTLLRLRQASICIHAITSWSEEANNLKATYKIAELGLLLSWNIYRKFLENKRKTKFRTAVDQVFNQFLHSYLILAERYFNKVIFPHVENQHSLSASVRSRESVDVNLILFENLGYLATFGIWSNFFRIVFEDSNPELSKALEEGIGKILDSMIQLINSNPTLHSPFLDDHMIEIALVMYFAQSIGHTEKFLPWIESISDQTSFALVANGRYPICYRDYRRLLDHPKSSDQSYRDDICTGSVLYPYVFLWLHWATDDEEILEVFKERLIESIPNCTHQAWFPDDKTDNLIWKGETYHGFCLDDLSPKLGVDGILSRLGIAIKNCAAINDMSAIKFGYYPIFLTACRHYRLPIPPNFWFIANQHSPTESDEEFLSEAS